MSSDDNRVVLSKEEALAMLPDGDEIHTFRNPGAGMLIGADWGRDKILKAIDEHEFELAGQQAASMGHGMAFHDGHGWVFVETKQKSCAS